MTTTRVACGLLLGVLAAAPPAEAQTPPPVATVGVLCVGFCPAPPLETSSPVFLNALREAGYTDGQNLVVDLGGVGDTLAQLPMLATRLIRRKVDVIVAMGAAAVLAAKQASTTVPIVMLDVPNALELGLVLALEERLPAIAWSRQFPAGGGLMSYGPSRPEMHRLAATVVVKILKGRRPSDIPVEQPTRYELVVNLATAKAIGVTIPPSVLARADEIIQ